MSKDEFTNHLGNLIGFSLIGGILLLCTYLYGFESTMFWYGVVCFAGIGVGTIYRA